MKLNIKTLFISFLGLTILSFGACEDMLDTDSSQVAFEDNNQIRNPADAFYTIGGILRELRELGDRYVIMGELRGDLMTASQYASVSLQEICDFEITSDNIYRDQRDYYKVINSCNYAIQKMDTTIFSRGEKIMLPAYAEIKAIRAWTYWQLAQIYGKVKYIEKPILSLDASLKEYPEMDMEQLATKLIADLAPYVGIRVNNTNNRNLSPDYGHSIQIPMLLGDLYLYQNQYALAASMYFDFMTYGNTDDRPYLLSGGNPNFVSRWDDKTFSKNTINISHILSYAAENISALFYALDAKEYCSKMINLTVNDKPSLLPAENYITFMRNSVYVDVDESFKITTTAGDLRGHIPSLKTNQGQVGDAYYYVDMPDGAGSQAMIYKYYNPYFRFTSSGYDPDNNKLVIGNDRFAERLAYVPYICLYRQPHLYLRYAQAVNRAEKPTLAYAVLKYGLTQMNVDSAKRVNPAELKGEFYTDIPKEIFDANLGTMARGLGRYVERDTINHVIPKLSSLKDSIEWVELRILDELAAETAFEGNRFFDLLCVSRRYPNHPEFMANKVSAKYANQAAMKAKLMSIENWFVK